MNNMRNKILSLLVLLLTAATGAWAQETATITLTSGQTVKTYENVTLPPLSSRFTTTPARLSTSAENGSTEITVHHVPNSLQPMLMEPYRILYSARISGI